MTDVMNKIWVEKYRPAKIEDCVLTKSIKEELQTIVKNNNPQNLMFFGKAGSGKTTAAIAMANELDAKYILINCTEESGIDTLRTKIRNFASSAALNGKQKIVILDEFDYANPNSFQPGMRGAIEMFADNCNFIITCNYPARIIPEIHSRCMKVDFTIPKSDRPIIASQMLSRCKEILDAEGVAYKEEVVAALVKKNFPDFRQTIIQLQRYSLKGNIDVGILHDNNQEIFKELLQYLKAKNHNECRRWLVEHDDVVNMNFYRALYELLLKNVKPDCLPKIILSIGDYQYKSAFVTDQEINAECLLIEIMYNAEFHEK